MGAKGFFRKVGHGFESAGTSAMKAAGGVLGKQMMTTALESAPLLMLKTGGYVKGHRNKAVKAILHGGETVLPYGVKPTKKQREAIAKNQREQRLGNFY